MNSVKDVFAIFKLLNYPGKILFDQTYKRIKENFDFKKEDSQRIKEIYSVMSFDDKLNVFLIESATLHPSFIRSVTTTFDKQYLQFLLLFSIDYSELVFVLPNREKLEAGKHKLKLTKLAINKKEPYYTDVDTLHNIIFENEENWRDLWRKWKNAFSVERVTDEFFEDYKNIFFALRNELIKQKLSRKDAHEFTLQFLNRVMFIYFVSKKDWLENTKFVSWLWTSYKKHEKYGSDKFYDRWLKQLFFKAFNNRSSEISDLPKEVSSHFLNFPYLNGGLFRENKLDKNKVEINDKMFDRVFSFFEKYNFTIKEDMPLESEVAVDPQMIGYVYESLANVAEEIYDRNDLGIFYTPRVEVNFICRRAVVEYLSKHLGDVPKEKIYHLVFDLPEDKDKIEQYFNEKKLWYKLEEVLDNLSAVDPACGSGAFLVGLLNVLAELYKMIYRHIKSGLSDFELKNKIIQFSLYGVDVMLWAIQAAELRLWLQLIVETEFKKDELRKHPLLPNLNLNLRVGDSLVQEIGGITFNVRTNSLKPFLKKKLENLKQEKRKYFENSPTAKFKTIEEFRDEEVRLFEEIIEERIESLLSDIQVLSRSHKQKGKQTGLFGAQINIEAKYIKKEKEELERVEEEIKLKQTEIEKLKKVKEILKDPEKKPFVWDIDFAEIFGDKNGFDIVIGNPPYVTRTLISPPNKIKAEVSKEERDEYKQKLIDSVKNRFPFISDLGKMCDYYIYFYFHGLGLLNENGTFCFITSNSWMSVGFGDVLKNFLAENCNIIGIYDSAKRSFQHAKINTVIVFLGHPESNLSLDNFSEKSNREDKFAKFVLFKKGFEDSISSDNLYKIDMTNSNLRTSDFALYVINQNKLIENNKDKLTKTERVISENWTLFKAPYIFFKILENDEIIDLSTIADVRVGFRTGANDFYYLPKNIAKDLNIEKEYLKPLISSPKECKTVFIDEKSLPNYVFLCNLPKSELKGTKALKYVEDSENKNILIKKGPEKGVNIKGYQNLELIRLSSRKNWYSLGEPDKPYIVLPLVYYKRPIVCINQNGLNP